MTFKHLLTISLLVLCVGFSPVWADDPVVAPDNGTTTPDPNPPVTPPNPVETFLQAAITFGDTLKTASNFDQAAYDAFVASINEIKTSVSTLPTTTSGYDTTTYFQTVTEKWGEMATQITASQHPYKNYIQGEYAQAVASYIKGDCSAVVNGWEATDCAGYYNNLNELYSARLQAAASTASSTLSYSPYNYLDRGAPAADSRGPVRVAVDTAGIYDKWLNYTVRQMVTSLQSKFSYDTQLQEDLNWFLNVWPQSSEILTTTVQADGTVQRPPDNTSQQCGSGREVYAVNANYTLNEYGQATSDELPQVLNSYPLVDQVYLDRQYGYNTTTKTGYGYTGYSNWQVSSYHIFNTVSIQVGDRNYQLYDSLAISPIVLDLDGDGNLEASKGEYLPHPYNGAKLVEFDINGDEFLELTEWVGPHDGILLQSNERDLNANAFFGEAGGFRDGYEKLSLLDTNNDKQLTGEELKTLSVWQDQNTNGKVDTGEISSVTALGITALSLTHQDLVSSFTQNGTTKNMWDWYPVAFRVKRTR